MSLNTRIVTWQVFWLELLFFFYLIISEFIYLVTIYQELFIQFEWCFKKKIEISALQYIFRNFKNTIWNFKIIITYLPRYIFNFPILLSHIFDLIIHDNVIEGSLNFQRAGTGFIDRFSIELLLLLNFYLRKIFDTTRVYDYRFPPLLPLAVMKWKYSKGSSRLSRRFETAIVEKSNSIMADLKIILNSILYSKSINFYKYGNRSPFYICVDCQIGAFTFFWKNYISDKRKETILLAYFFLYISLQIE